MKVVGTLARASDGRDAFRNIASTDVTDFTEAVQDVVGALIASGNGIVVTYDDAGNTETIRAAVRLAGGIPGIVTATTLIPIGVAPYAFNVSATNTVFFAITAATGSYTLTLKKRTQGGAVTTIGTLVWSAAGTVATTSISSAAVGAGDMLYLDPGGSVDATLAGIGGIVSE